MNVENLVQEHILFPYLKLQQELLYWEKIKLLNIKSLTSLIQGK